MGFKTLRTILSSVTHNGKQVKTDLSLPFPEKLKKAKKSAQNNP
jgi:hypothetical protein